MPNIAEVDAGSGAIQAPERGSEAFAQEGRRVGAFYHQIGQDVGGTVQQLGDQYVKHQTDLEVSHLYAATTTAEQNLETAWQTYSTDPANRGRPDLASSFMQDHVQPVLEDLQSHAQTDTGKRLAAEETARVSQNIFHRTVADQSDLDAAQWHNNVLQTQSNLAAGADLSNMDQRIGDWNTVASNTMPSTVSADQRSRLSEQLQNEGAARVTASAYLNSFEAIKQGLAAGQDVTAADTAARAALAANRNFQYLTPEQQTEMTSRLDEAEARGKEMFRTDQAGQKAAIEEQTNAQIGQIRGSLLPDSNGNPPDPHAAAAALDRLHQLTNSANPVVAATAGREAEAIGNVIKTQAEDRLTGRLTPDDPSAVAEINQRKSIPPGQPGALTKVELDDMRAAHQISDTTYTEQTRRLDDLSSNPQLREAEARLTSFMRGSIDPQLTGAPDAGENGGMTLFAPTVNPRAKAASGIALNQAIAEFENRVDRGMPVDAAYREMTDPGSPSSMWHVVPYWKQVAANGPGWAAQHPVTVGNPGAAPPPAPALDAAVARVQATGAIRPGESWTAYKARAGIQ